jgi:hypothetical protein
LGLDKNIIESNKKHNEQRLNERFKALNTEGRGILNEFYPSNKLNNLPSRDDLKWFLPLFFICTGSNNLFQSTFSFYFAASSSLLTHNLYHICFNSILSILLVFMYFVSFFLRGFFISRIPPFPLWFLHLLKPQNNRWLWNHL